tara:strand:- start:899 stop:1255 length:357 start_codon:yes stop_codon:yes gene_type:complete
MRGNIYISLNTPTYNGLIPNELLSKYGIPEYDVDGNQLNLNHPTFKELGVYNKIKFGEVIKVVIGSSNYYVMELDASWKDGEVSSLLSLGTSLSYPRNSVMNNDEAIKFIRDNASDIF